MYTVSEENYIKGIYHLQQYNQNVSTNELADKLHTEAASVTDMLKKLQGKKLLEYERYYGVRLTAEGKKLALAVIRRHRLWEYFLVNHLSFGWGDVHEIAEQLEHVQSQALIDKLDAYMNFPRFDPHGDPIPDSKGRMETQNQVSLLQLEPGHQAAISSVSNQSPELLEMLRKKNLEIGTKLVVKQRFAFDNSVEIKMDSGTAFSISGQLARHLFVKKID